MLIKNLIWTKNNISMLVESRLLRFLTKYYTKKIKKRLIKEGVFPDGDLETKSEIKVIFERSRNEI